MEDNNIETKQSKVSKKETYKISPSYLNKPKKKKEKLKKNKFILPLILILLLVGVVGYIGYDKWQEREVKIFTLGAEYGYDVRLLEIFNQGLNCNEPITINNGTLEINLIAIECLNIPEE